MRGVGFIASILLGFAIALASPSARAEEGDVSIEWAYLATYPDADCTHIHVYLKNLTDKPIAVPGVYLGKHYLDGTTF